VPAPLDRRARLVCSSEEGGWATVAPEGPRCEGGCQPPDQNSCNLVDNIDDNDQ
jgi:hypothetical protein